MFVFVYNAHHYDMNYLLTYYFIDFLLYQLWKCRDIYMFLFFMTPMCLVGFQDPWNHYIWSNEETIIHMHDLNQPWSIYSVQRYKSVRCKSVKSFTSSYHFNIFPHYNASDQPQSNVFFSSLRFYFHIRCYALEIFWWGSGFLCNRWTCLYNVFNQLSPYQEVHCITWLCLTLSLQMNGSSNKGEVKYS